MKKTLQTTASHVLNTSRRLSSRSKHNVGFVESLDELSRDRKKQNPDFHKKYGNVSFSDLGIDPNKISPAVFASSLDQPEILDKFVRAAKQRQSHTSKITEQMKQRQLNESPYMDR